MNLIRFLRKSLRIGLFTLLALGSFQDQEFKEPEKFSVSQESFSRADAGTQGAMLGMMSEDHHKWSVDRAKEKFEEEKRVSRVMGFVFVTLALTGFFPQKMDPLHWVANMFSAKKN